MNYIKKQEVFENYFYKVIEDNYNSNSCFKANAITYSVMQSNDITLNEKGIGEVKNG